MLSKFKYIFVALVASGLIFCLSNIVTAFDEPPARVIVQVIALGSPIEHAEVSVGDASETTGKNGNYVFQVDKGIYTVSVVDSHGNTDSREVRMALADLVDNRFAIVHYVRNIINKTYRINSLKPIS